MTQKWFTQAGDFFGERYLRMYDAFLTPERTEQEIVFLEQILQPTTKTNILDVPCGHGRHSIALANRGYSVTGYELNEHFLEVARNEARIQGATVTWSQGDMRNVNFDEEFDVALNLFTSMGYFDNDTDDQRFLDSVYHALRPGGEFVLDYLNTYRLLRQFKPQNWEQLSDGTYVLHQREFKIEKGTMHETRTHLDTDGEHIVETRVRFYTAVELLTMLRQSGFAIIATYGDFTGSPLSMDANRLIIHARKN